MFVLLIKDLIYKTGLKAIRIKKLPENSIKFETTSSETYFGFIEKEAAEIKSKQQQDSKLNANRRSETLLNASSQQQLQVESSPSSKLNQLQSIASSPAFSTLIQQQQKSDEQQQKYEPGLIRYEVNGEAKQIPYFTFSINNQKNKNMLNHMDKVCFQSVFIHARITLTFSLLLIRLNLTYTQSLEIINRTQ